MNKWYIYKAHNLHYSYMLYNNCKTPTLKSKRYIFNSDLPREVGMIFQSSWASLLNVIPPKVTLFTFGMI